jgi:hypothetical protein
MNIRVRGIGGMMVLIMLLAVACSSSEDLGSGPPATGVPPTSVVVPLPLPTPVDEAPIGTPIQTPLPTSEPVIVEVSPIPTIPVDISAITVPVCRTTSDAPDGLGIGTVPHATPTPIPGPGASGAEPQIETQNFVTALAPFIDAVESLAEASEDARGLVESSEDLVRVVTFEGRRISYLCTALGLVPRTTDGEGLIKRISDALTERQLSLSATAERLRDGATLSDVVDAGGDQTSDALLGLPVEVDNFARSAGVGSTEAAAFTLFNPLLGVQFDSPVGWLALRNGIDIVLGAPSDQQVYSARGLGPAAWKLGTALRVRRFRNNPGWGLADAVATLDSLYVKFGERVSHNSSRIDEVDAVVRAYEDQAGNWLTLVAVAVVGDVTYLFELGCPDESGSGCTDSLETFTGSVQFIDN